MLLKKVFTGKMKSDIIDYWDKQLVEAGERIILARKDIVKKLEEHASRAYQQLSGSDLSFKLEYEDQLLNNDSTAYLKDIFLNELKKKRRAEIERGQTLVGPHRDDVAIYLDKVDLRTFGSQGEQRSASLALKMAELSIVTERGRDFPVLLLDDVMSELDGERRRALLEQIESGIQAIITSTQAEQIAEYSGLSINIIRIE
jgi:DNA replication and repair protein RecF